MKYPPKIYAEAFAEAAMENKDKEREGFLIKNFLKIIGENKDNSKLKKIFWLCEKIVFQKAGRKKILIESARMLNKAQRSAFDFLAGENGKIEEKINPGLIAGVRITIDQEKQFDGSFFRKIKSLFS